MERVVFSNADFLPSAGGPFHLIVANLPYIATGDLPGLAPEVGHDPRTALDGGPDGLDLIRRLAQEAPAHLAPGGVLLLEIGAGQAAAVAELLGQSKYRDISVRPDYQEVPRFAVAFHG
jgi:release factor glutamine methyltransferase